MTTSVGSVVNEWGSPSNLLGLISSLCMFTDPLSASSVKTLHKKGAFNSVTTDLTGVRSVTADLTGVRSVTADLTGVN